MDVVSYSLLPKVRALMTRARRKVSLVGKFDFRIPGHRAAGRRQLWKVLVQKNK